MSDAPERLVTSKCGTTLRKAMDDLALVRENRRLKRRNKKLEGALCAAVCEWNRRDVKAREKLRKAFHTLDHPRPKPSLFWRLFFALY